MRSDLALTPSEGVGIGERYFPEKPKIVPGVIRRGKIPTWGIGWWCTLPGEILNT
ncbi:hypothetical protein AAEP15_004629 [Salmonella enterica subsp. enterica serovar Chester]